jgi:hypothetical protein
MPEQLAFKEAWRHCGTVQLNEIPASAWAEFVDRPCDHFFARAGLARDQDGGIRGCYRLHLREDGAQAAAASHDRFEE